MSFLRSAAQGLRSFLFQRQAAASPEPQPQRELSFERLETRVLMSASLALGSKSGAVPVASAVALPTDDRAEENDTLAKAANLVAVHKPQNFVDFVLNDDDWYKFKIDRTGEAHNYVQIGFLHILGDIDMSLHDSRGTQLRTSNSSSNFEFISLDGLAKGTYYLKVFGWRGSTNPSYDLTVVGPNDIDAQHTLFVNFDGATLTRADLNRWDNGEWLTGLLAAWDTGNDGITVGAFEASISYRETLIAGIIKNLAADLKPYGFQVARHYGLAFESMKATTLFFGPKSLDNGNSHVANDIDYGNHNLTDIAFVSDEHDAWGTVPQQIRAYSDVALHEAGHTFGLYHVLSGGEHESMGLRYNLPQADWDENTKFMNKYYTMREDPGNGLQNSHQYMRDVFVKDRSLTSVPFPPVTTEDLFAADLQFPTTSDPVFPAWNAIPSGGLPGDVAPSVFATGGLTSSPTRPRFLSL